MYFESIQPYSSEPETKFFFEPHAIWPQMPKISKCRYFISTWRETVIVIA